MSVTEKAESEGAAGKKTILLKENPFPAKRSLKFPEVRPPDPGCKIALRNWEKLQRPVKKKRMQKK